MGAGNLSSLMNFVSFSEYLGLPVDGFEKEFASLLMKLEGRKMVLHKGGAEGWALVAKRERAGKWFPRVQARVGKSGSKDGSRLTLFSPGVSSYVLAACWDAAALAQFWSWLEEEILKGVLLTEVDVADKLLQFRSMQAGFLDTSFDTISDSGAQYIDGTTDITRTVHFGEPTPRQKECFTRVLQGHIALDQAVFPENTPGFVLDAFARSFLWKIGLDYRHGTGHGVGAALNVHEGPQSISFRFGNMTPLQKGMIVSNEPGYYEDHAFGIRIENLLCVKEMDTPIVLEVSDIWDLKGSHLFQFRALQACRFNELVELSLLSNAEIDWLNDYHSEVWEKVSGHQVFSQYSSCIAVTGWFCTSMALGQHTATCQTVIESGLHPCLNFCKLMAGFCHIKLLFTHLEIPGLGIFPLKGRVRAVELMLLKKDEASLECWS
ncbi:putative Xaa-Pro aminopeptidase P [Vitis vinifera]|uniref:Putative Xaa-Pro aminopeptidase P n=1 Tax=Vitis vinifera TaxID=29760 RepID=A0A438F0C4_VITVI|nr:putative Xaa-Pro aminopeptidase P [Vitis vinifera]